MILLDLATAKEAAEEDLGLEIPEEVAGKVLAYSARKCAVNRKGTDYLPVLYRNELRDYYTRLAINLKGAMACV